MCTHVNSKYECFVDNQIQQCSIIRKCKKKKRGEDMYIVSLDKKPDQHIKLRALNINFNHSEEWRILANQNIEANQIKKQIISKIDDFLRGSCYSEKVLNLDHKINQIIND